MAGASSAGAQDGDSRSGLCKLGSYITVRAVALAAAGSSFFVVFQPVILSLEFEQRAIIYRQDLRGENQLVIESSLLSLLVPTLEGYNNSNNSNNDDNTVTNENLGKTISGKLKVIVVSSEVSEPITVYEGLPVPNCSSLCTISLDPMSSQTADAVVWNAKWTNAGKIPKTKPSGQRWVFSCWYESPIYSGHHVSQENVAALKQNVDWTLSYRSESDFVQPMGAMQQIPDSRGVLENAAQGKDKLLLWFASNCEGSRMEFFSHLTAMLPPGRVVLHGGCGTSNPCSSREGGRTIMAVAIVASCVAVVLRGLGLASDRLLLTISTLLTFSLLLTFSRANKIEDPVCLEKLYGKFKFYASFENSRCKDYITEKLWRPYMKGMVPLVLGGLGRADYENLVPGASFVHVDDFGSMRDLADFLLKVDGDDGAYSKFFAWRSSMSVMEDRWAQIKPYCTLCEALHKPPDQQQPQRRFGNLTSWFYDSCREEVPYL
ncbi:unnamed protein product [Polarella glacialis]|uniref:Fucosyltransferase n=1 Tax=Polarella glacialis TaxID=89957 RepID=A0A813GZ94_POLGL|nr:unnamed protein product [Polarella glacialis]